MSEALKRAPDAILDFLGARGLLFECGARILGGSDIPVLNMASEIALGHHEHWDGSGYPAGLAGNQVHAERTHRSLDEFAHESEAVSQSGPGIGGTDA